MQQNCTDESKTKESIVKAEYIKIHIHKQQYTIESDKWGDEIYVLNNISFKTKAEVKKAVNETKTNEFDSRNKK